MPEKRVAALVGDYYHRAAPMVEVLEEACGALGCTLVAEEDADRFPWGRLDEFILVVVARDGRTTVKEQDSRWSTATHEKAIETYTLNGGGLVVLHAGLASYDPGGAYESVTRGYFLMHPQEHPNYIVAPLSSRHAIAEGIAPFTIQDEMYFVKVDAARTNKLFESRHDDYGVFCAGWWHEYGKGRVFCFTPGHRDEVLAHGSYRAIVTQGMKWAIRQR